MGYIAFVHTKYEVRRTWTTSLCLFDFPFERSGSYKWRADNLIVGRLITMHTQIQFAFAVCCEFIFPTPISPSFVCSNGFHSFFFSVSISNVSFSLLAGKFPFSVFEFACSPFLGFFVLFFLACFDGLVKLIRHSGAAAAAAAKTRRNTKQKNL